MLKLISCVLGTFIINASLMSKEIIYIDPTGEAYSLPISSSDQFEDVIEDLTLYAQSTHGSSLPIALNVMVTEKEVVVKNHKPDRDYHVPVTPQEKKELEFLVTKMAWEKNPKRLWDLESEMNKAGDRIMHLHPLKFLEAICTDDKLCAGLKAIRTRTILVWPRFLKGSVTTLKEEHKYNNVLPFIEEFAETIGVDVKYLMPHAKKENWDEFVKVVADKVERTGDTKRYDM